MDVALRSGDSWTEPLLELAVVDSSGQTHNSLSSLATCGTPHQHRQLGEWGNGTTQLYFEVPASGSDTLRWTPNALNDTSYYQTNLS